MSISPINNLSSISSAENNPIPKISPDKNHVENLSHLFDGYDELPESPKRIDKTVENLTEEIPTITPSEISSLEEQENQPVEKEPLNSKEESSLENPPIGTQEEIEKKEPSKIRSFARALASGSVKGLKFIAEHKKTLFITAIVISCIALTIFSFGAGLIPIVLLPVAVGGSGAVLMFIADHYIQNYASKIKKEKTQEHVGDLLQKAKADPKQKKILEKHLFNELSSRHLEKIKKRLLEENYAQEEINKIAAKRLKACVNAMMENAQENPSPAGQIYACLLAKEKLHKFTGSDQAKGALLEEIQEFLSNAGIKNAHDIDRDKPLESINGFELDIFNSTATAAFIAKLLKPKKIFLKKILQQKHLQKRFL